MTKTLTEQWRAGNLKKSFYYLKFPDTETAEIYNLYDMEKFRYVQASEKIEVLDEVPSYDEYRLLKKEIDSLKEQIHSMLFTDDVVQERYDKAEMKIYILEMQLEIATKALKGYENKQNWDKNGISFMKYNKGFTLAKKALKETEDVK